VAAVLAVAVALAAVGVSPFDSISGRHYAVVACAAFGVIATAQVAAERLP